MIEPFGMFLGYWNRKFGSAKIFQLDSASPSRGGRGKIIRENRGEKDEEGSMKCRRCSGFMANERFYGPGEPFLGWRCVLCGEIFDPLILQNRENKAPFGLEESKGVSSKGTKEVKRHADPRGRREIPLSAHRAAL
jgi:hypothetical protein